jgi:hypothetical protein
MPGHPSAKPFVLLWLRGVFFSHKPLTEKGPFLTEKSQKKLFSHKEITAIAPVKKV